MNETEYLKQELRIKDAEIEALKSDNKSISDSAQQFKNMIETFIANIPSIWIERVESGL